jgi:dTDP-4-dehydrorhamnose 3,5-epimerase
VGWTFCHRRPTAYGVQLRFVPTAVSGAFVVEIEAHRDERGMFARSFDAEIFRKHGLAADYPQCSISSNPKRGTMRGMHYQAEPRPEIKLVRATRGRVFDVALDLRKMSPTFLSWAAVELDASRHNAFYIPAGCAHGFLTLEDDSELFYQVSEVYVSELARGVRWDDPAFSIQWPFAPTVIGERDLALETYSQEISI